MEIEQIWEVKYKIQPTLSKSESFGDYDFEVINKSTVVTKTYKKITVLSEKRIKSKLALQSPPEKEIQNDQQVIRKILLKRMVYTGAFSEISVEPTTSLINKEQLENDGFRITKESRAICKQHYGLFDVDNDFISTCESFWASGFKGASTYTEEELLFISDWVERSVVETKPIQSFMLLWVAFNCVYDLFTDNLVSPNSGDSFFKIKKVLSELLNESDITNILGNHKRELNALVSYDLIVPQREGQQEDTPISFQLGRMMEENVPPYKVICKAMRCVYAIRNNLFHQGSLTTDIESQAGVAKNFLLSVTSKMLRNMINH